MTRGWMVRREELIDVMVGEGFLVEDCNSGRSDYADDFWGGNWSRDAPSRHSEVA